MPVAILQRSRPVAYLVNADSYDRQLAELAATRRALFLREVREAEAEYQSGGAVEYDEIESLWPTCARRALRALHRLEPLPAPAEEAARTAGVAPPSGAPALCGRPSRPATPYPRARGDLAAYWAFSADDDLRVLFRWEGDVAFLVHLGSPDEVY